MVETRLIAVAACAQRGELGLNKRLPWYLPKDLEHFKKTTEAGILIMGRTTFESLGKPLPKRHHIVLSSSFEVDHPAVTVVRSLTDLFQLLSDKKMSKAFVVGGEVVFKELIPYCHEAIITHVHASVIADSYFPLESLRSFEMTKTHLLLADELNPFSMNICYYNNCQLLRK